MEKILSADIIGDQQPRSSEYYGYVYVTTNLINNKKYIGAHKSSKFDPNYKGSGKLLNRAINKYGIENFKAEVLKWCSSKEELFEEEAKFIEKYNCVESPDYYNVMPGGHGGDNKSYLSEQEYLEFRRKISKSKSNRPRTEKELEQLRKLHERMKGFKHSEESKRKSRESNLGKIRSEEARKKMSENHADFRGEKNPFYGKKHSEETKKKISSNNARAHKGKVWLTNKKDIEILIPYSDIDKYPDYVRGRLRKRQRQELKQKQLRG